MFTSHLLTFFSNRSQAVVVDKIMYISGQLGIDASSGDLVSGGVEQEADQVGYKRGMVSSVVDIPEMYYTKLLEKLTLWF